MGQGAALVLTLVVECLVVVVLLRPSVIGMSRILAVAAAASLLTHPFAWRAAAALSPDGYAQGVAIIETVVVLVEAAVLRLLLPVGARRALVIATVANLASFTAGLALMAPVPLYIVALALFGLPHVVWEMAFVKSRYGARWPLRWWHALWVVLAAVGWVSPPWVAASDIATLALIGAIVVCAPRGTGIAARLVGAAGSLALAGLLAAGEPVVALLWLSLLHNFTPLLLAWDLAREDATQRAVAWGVTALMALPVLVVVGAIGSPGLAAWIATAQGGASGTAPLASQLPFGATPALLPALLTALVLAQCAHYLSVIHLLPQAEARRSGRPPLPQRARSLALLASAVMAAFFLIDHAEAREWYAVAAGAHAWLEWPVLLMAWLGGGALLAQAGEGLERGHA
jgi:hypothetical protein